MAATKLDEALLIELGISDDRLNRELARAYAKAIRDNRKLETELNRVTNGAVERMGAGFERMGMDAQRSTRVATVGVIGLGNAMQRARPQIQNAAFQIGDFATQVAGGTRASTALAQQLPQLLGGFGAVGAVLGAAVAVGIPAFSAALGATSEQAVTLEDALKNLESQVSDYRSAVDNANLSTEDMIEKYGRLAAAGQRVSDILAGLALAQTLESLSETIDIAAGAFANSETLMTALSDARARSGGDVAQMRQEIEALAENLGLTEQSVRGVVMALNALANAEGPRMQADAAQAVLDAMIAALGPVEGMTGAARELASQMAIVADSAAQTTAQMEGMHGNLQLAAGAANALAGGLTAAQGPAAGLLGTLQQVAAAAWQAAYAMAVTDDFRAQNQALGDDERGSQRVAAAGARQFNTEQAIQRANERLQSQLSARTPSGGGSPGGGGSTVGQEPEYWDELIDKVREGEQAWESYTQTVERGANAMADFFTSIVDGSKSAKEALADLLMQLAQVQIQKAFLGLAGAGGTTGSIFSALGSALTVPSFDGGGYTGSGARTGGLDGKGGFPALLHPNETVIDHTKAGSAGGGQVSVVVRMEGGNLVPVIESVSGSVTAKAMAGYDRQLNARIRQANGDRRAL